MVVFSLMLVLTETCIWLKLSTQNVICGSRLGSSLRVQLIVEFQ